MPLTVTPIAADAPVSLADLAAHLRVSESSPLLAEYLAAAVDYAETRLNAGLTLATRSATLYAADIGRPYYLRRGPVAEILAITAAGQALAASAYTLEGDRLTVSTTAEAPIVVSYRSGWKVCPPSIRAALLMHAATLYEHRESVTERERQPVPHTLDAFYAAHCRAAGMI